MLLSPMQLMANDAPAAATSATQALQLFRDLGDRAGQAQALTQLGFLHVVTDDRPPPPNCTKRWSCSVTSATGAGKAMPSTLLARYIYIRGTTGPLPPNCGKRWS
jgi:hypothetical protein